MKLSTSDPDIETIVARINRGEIDLQPDFQRGEVWDNKRRQRLIDSILRDWYVPAVHVVRDPSVEPEIVLDGQQRLAAIRDFFADKFPVDGLIEPRTSALQELHGLRYSKLPDAIRRKLNRFTIPFVTLREFDPAEPNELFFRLNQSYNLTPPEKRNALHGAARHQVKRLVEDLITAGLLQTDVVGFTNGRLAYDDIVARACLAVQVGNLRVHINNTVVERFYREERFDDATIDRVGKSGLALKMLCDHLQGKVRFNKATLFTWLVFCDWASAGAGRDFRPTLLDEFESYRRAIKRGERERLVGLPPELLGPLALFDDRASYRVTDVSSVLARDCVLYLFLQRTQPEVPAIRGTDRLLAELNDVAESAAQQRVLEFVNESDWGHLTGVGDG